MGQISYENYSKIKEGKEGQSSGTRVSFFSLKNNGDESLVRIMHDSTADFDLVMVHPIQIDGRWRNVNCLRTPEEPLEKCPFCAAERTIRSKIYIHLLEYTRGEDGNVVCTPKLWERPASYVSKIKNLMDQYGPLSDSLFKIKRNGAAGSLETTYDIMYAPPMAYKPEAYPKDTSVIGSVKAIGTSVLVKSAEEMQKMLSGDTVTESKPTVTTNVTQSYNQPNTAENVQIGTSGSVYRETAAPIPSSDGMVRPRRYY